MFSSGGLDFSTCGLGDKPDNRENEKNTWGSVAFPCFVNVGVDNTIQLCKQS